MDDFDLRMYRDPWEKPVPIAVHYSTNVYAGAKIPDSTKVGAFCDIGSSLGEDSKVQSHVSISPGWKLGNRVFYGPGCRFANDKHPKIGQPFTANGGVVEDDVVIGMGALIGPGVHIGQGAVIGMGAVVLHDVPAGETWVGNPARKL